MGRTSRSLIQSALGLAFVIALVPGAQAYQAYQAPKRHHYYHVYGHVYGRPIVHHPGDIYVTKTVRSYLDPGPSAPEASDDLYFNDTKYPHYLLGPGIFQRSLTSDGEYN